MKTKMTFIAVLAVLFVAGSAFAQMPGGGMGGGMMDGWQSAGPGYGMHGGGQMMSRMYGRTLNQGYLGVLKPIKTPAQATAAVQAFLATSATNLRISEVWEYQTAYKAELSDTQGQKAFDILADKLTGAVMPEMGFSMMMNASWGGALGRTRNFRANLVLSPQDATAAAEAFLAKNAGALDYTLGDPETYPGYYKLHTTDASGNPAMEIMVNGYNGRIWMNTLMGAPISGPLAP